MFIRLMFYCQTLIQKILCSNIFVFTCGCVVPLRHSVCMDPEIFSGGVVQGYLNLPKGEGFFFVILLCKFQIFEFEF